MRIIGITGTIGAGKGTVVDYLVTRYGFKHYSAREVFVEEIKRRNMPVNRDSMLIVANDLRTMHHPGWAIEQLYRRAVTNGGDAVIESVRALGEIEFLRSIPERFSLFAVDADPKLRYERVLVRRSVTDQVTFDEFIEKELREMNSQDPTQPNLAGCIALADHVMSNNGNIDDLHRKVDIALEKFS